MTETGLSTIHCRWQSVPGILQTASGCFLSLLQKSLGRAVHLSMRTRKNQSSGINSPKSLIIDNSDKEIVNLNSKRKNKNKDKIIPCIKLERLKKKIKQMNNNEFQFNKKKFKLQNSNYSKRFFVGKLTKKTDSLATIDINNNETITSNENKIKEEKNFNIINLKRNSKSNLMNNIMRRSNSSNSFFDENLKENSILYQRLTGRTFFRKGTIKTIDAMKSNPIIFQKPVCRFRVKKGSVRAYIIIFFSLLFPY